MDITTRLNYMSYKDIFLFYFKGTNGYRMYYALMLVATCIVGFEPILHNYVVEKLIDLLSIESTQIFSVICYMLVFVLLMCLLELMYWLIEYSKLHSFPYVNTAIMNNVYDSVQNKQYTFFQHNQSGIIMSKVKAINSSCNDVIEDISDVIKDVVGLLVSVLYMFLIDRHMGILLSLWTVVFLFVMIRFSMTFSQYVCTENNSLHSVMNSISDRIMNIKSIISFVTFKKELYSLNKFIQKSYLPSAENTCKYKIKFMLIGGSIYITAIFLTMLYAIYLKHRGLISLGSVAAIFGLSLAIVSNLWCIIYSLQYIMEDLGEIKSAFSIIENTNQFNNAGLVSMQLSKAPSIEFRHVSFSYSDDEYDVLSDFNLTIKPGEMVGVVGRSGVGKSSLLSLLLKYFECSEGSVIVDGIDINTVTSESLRKYISLIPQDTVLFNRSIMENMKYASQNASDNSVFEVCKKIGFHETIMKMPHGYDTLAGEKGGNLSGGQRQLVSIVRAFLKRSPILLLDEATSALDIMTEDRINHVLDMLIGEVKPTLISIAHRLSTVRRMDRVVIIGNGNILENGSPEELLNDKYSLFYKMWNMQ